MKSLINWMKNGNDCDKCKYIYENWSAYHEDCDCGCTIKGTYYDEKPCYILKPIAWLLNRRTEYYASHQYDGFGDFYEKLEVENEKCRNAIIEMLDGKVMCYKNTDGTFHECNTKMIIKREAWRVRDALTPEFTPLPNLRQRWKSLLYDTVMFLPNKVKPFICK